MLAITNAELVLRDHYLPNAVLFVEDGIITRYGELRSTPIPSGCEILDAGGAYLAPGLIDIHTHSAGGTWFYDDPASASQYVLRHGTTTVLSALYFSMNKGELLDAARKIQTAKARPECANLLGLYMEAPYLNPKFGCNRESNPWRGSIKESDYRELVDRIGTDVMVWGVAPERENILQFVSYARKVNPNVRFSVAHSEATPQQVEALIPYGLCIGTHHTNATGTLVKYPECRGVCVDEAVNYCREIYAELICDSRGIHVDPYMLRLVRRMKGGDRLILISDAFVSDGPIPPGYEGVTDINFDHSGEIAGSNLTLEVACRNMMKHTGSSLVDVFQYASYNPAKALGLSDRGEIAVGKRADLVVIDDKINIQKVILKGEVQS